MSCFIGVSVEEKLDESIYQLALSEIQDFVSETAYKILPHQNLLLIACRYQKFCLSKNSSFLHSHLQHLLISEEEDENFVEALVQCLMILKEYFPHKIQIEMVSDLQQIFNMKAKIDQEIPRRLISHLKILNQKSKKTGLSQQQIHMLIKNLVTEFHKDYKQKIKALSLKIMCESKLNPEIWNTLSKSQIKIIDEIVNQPLYQKVGIEILEKIVRNNDYKSFPFSEQKQNQSPNSFRNELSQDEKIPEFDGPLDTMTALFQLKQSLNISRLSWIIQNVNCQKLEQKKLKKFDTKIKQVVEKFLNGFYPEVPVLHAKNFVRCLTEYQMRRTNLSWSSLIEQVLMKIEQIERQAQKQRSRIKSSIKQIKP